MQFRAHNRDAYTLVEMLVVIAILALLAALTVGSLRASRNHQVLEQSAGKIEMLLESAKAHAVASGSSVFLVTTEADSLPSGIGFRALTLLKTEEDQTVRLREWMPLPHGVALAPDPVLSDGDVMRDPPRLIDPLPLEDPDARDVPRGDIRVLVQVTPDGRFHSGSEPRARPAHLVVRRGEWFRDATGSWLFDGGEHVDAMRILLRPLTGITRAERVETP